MAARVGVKRKEPSSCSSEDDCKRSEHHPEKEEEEEQQQQCLCHREDGAGASPQSLSPRCRKRARVIQANLKFLKQFVPLRNYSRGRFGRRGAVDGGSMSGAMALQALENALSSTTVQPFGVKIQNDNEDKTDAEDDADTADIADNAEPLKTPPTSPIRPIVSTPPRPSKLVVSTVLPVVPVHPKRPHAETTPS